MRVSWCHGRLLELARNDVLLLTQALTQPFLSPTLSSSPIERPCTSNPSPSPSPSLALALARTFLSLREALYFFRLCCALSRCAVGASPLHHGCAITCAAVSRVVGSSSSSFSTWSGLGAELGLGLGLGRRYRLGLGLGFGFGLGLGLGLELVLGRR